MSKKRKKPSSNLNTTSFEEEYPEYKCLLRPNFRELAESYAEFASQYAKLKDRQTKRRGKQQRLQKNEGSSNVINTLAANVDAEFNASLTRALLDKHFGLALPSLPKGHLCPPVPNRFHYVLWMKQLWKEAFNSSDYFEPPADESDNEPLSSHPCYRGLDIGTGASAIYPLLLSKTEFSTCTHEDESRSKWEFLGTDIDPQSIQCANQNIAANGLTDTIQVALVPPTPRMPERTSHDDILSTLLLHQSNLHQQHADPQNCIHVQESLTPLCTAIQKAKSIKFIMQKSQSSNTSPADNICTPIDTPHLVISFDFVMTNPPFYETEEEATLPRAGDLRERTDMTLQESVYPNGGEVGFVLDMVRDSFYLRDCITWFSSMLGKKASMLEIEKELKSLGFDRGSLRTTEFVQGKTIRWGIAWTFRKVALRSLGEILCKLRVPTSTHAERTLYIVCCFSYSFSLFPKQRDLIVAFLRFV